jgi:signal-transduction protein with cAMP-binding, CBS, and nucleotidyltransferase domain
MTSDFSLLARLDSFPYRHRLSDVMTRPVLTGDDDMTLGQACDRMDHAGVSSLVVVDAEARAVGIVTDRDVLRCLSRAGAAALDIRLAEVMSSPVATVPGDAFLFVGLARMMRLGLHHLVVADSDRRPIGMITARALLKVRADQALVIGDDLSQAQTSADLARVRRTLPVLAGNLLADDVPARTVAAIISSVLRDMTAQAGKIGETAMLQDGWGPAPADWSLLILGSGGRGESTLGFDQDNAIVHAGSAVDGLWYGELGRRVNDILNDAGIPYCEGEVMARNPVWCRSLDDWKSEIRRWVFEPKMQTVMYVDIFFDLVAVLGDEPLALALKRYAFDTAAESAFFLQFLAFNVASMDVPLGIFGEFTTTHGRLNAKKLGLLPLVSAGRAKAVRAGILAPATADRYAALADAGLLHPDDRAGLLEAHETILRAILVQQLADIAGGREPSSRIEPRKLPRSEQRRLKDAFKRIRTLRTLIGSVMAG